MSSKSSFYNSTGVTNTQSNAIDASVDNAEASAVASENSANSASASASTATTKASEASTSASTATTKASEASTSASTATTKASEASTSATTATTKATESANSATASANSATAASTSSSTATTKASEASSSASTALSHKNDAQTAKTAAETAETNAETAETNAASSATAASTSASSASTSATTATTKAGEAATSASTATTKANEAATSASNANTAASTATTKASEASTSANNAASSATAASASKDAALAALDSFDDRYLGVKSSNPTVDNDGNALVAGSLYFNSTDDTMKVYEGSTWVAAYASLSGAVLQTGSAMTGDLSFGNNDKAIFGAGDLEIYHDGSTSYISDQGTGNLKILAQNFIVSNPANTETMIAATPNGNVSLYYDSAVKLATTSTGIDVTGTVTSTGLIGNATNFDIRQNTSDGSDSKRTRIGGGGDVVSSRGAMIEMSGNEHGNGGMLFLHAGHGGTYSQIRSFTSNVQRLRIASTGDISFYEDTGTTAKFFWDASTERLGIGNAAPATTLDVNGTVTADGLTVAQGSGANILLESTTTGATAGDIFGEIEFKTNDSNSSGIKGKIDSYSEGNVGSGALRLFTGDTTGLYQRLNIASNGDISFYEDTGTTAKFFWDASAENLGIGGVPATNSSTLQITDDATTSNNLQLVLAGSTNTSKQMILGFDTTADKSFITSQIAGSAQKPLIINASAVGLGTSSPSTTLEVNGYGKFTSSDNSPRLHITGGRDYMLTTTASGLFGLYDNTASSYRLAVDTSGNVLVGESSNFIATSTSATGLALTQDGRFTLSRSGTPMNVGRLGSDGSLIDFWRQGAAVGSIGSNGSYPYIGSHGTSGKGIKITDALLPATNAGAFNDADVNLGASNVRWKDLYLSGGVYLGGTGSANKLSDFETGTWTGTLRGSTGAPNTAQTSSGKYTKVGNTVTVTATFANKDVTGATGLVQITGLPFTSTSEVHLGHFANNRGQTNQYAGYLPAASTNLYQTNYSGSSQAWASTGSGTYAFLTITYITA